MTNAIPTQITVRKLGKSNCRPCMILGHILNEEKEALEKVDAIVIEHNIEKEPEILAKYNKKGNPIASVPVLIFERNGVEISRINGLCNIDDIFGAIEYAKTAK